MKLIEDSQLKKYRRTTTSKSISGVLGQVRGMSNYGIYRNHKVTTEKNMDSTVPLSTAGAETVVTIVTTVSSPADEIKL